MESVIQTNYLNTKVYFDGSHFIGIPSREKEMTEKKVYSERFIEVYEYIDESLYRGVDLIDFFSSSSDYSNYTSDEIYFDDKIKLKRVIEIKDYFNELYLESFYFSKKEQRAYIFSKLRPYFDGLHNLSNFVDYNLKRKKRNLISKKVRLMRKALLQQWTYFATFTYDSNKLHEEEFKRKLRTCLSHLSHRNGWKYIGVWEYSPQFNRLHFHCLLYVPEGKMVGDFKEVEDYSFKRRKRYKSIQNTFFNERFGRSDFSSVSSSKDVSREVSYMLKYLSKSGEKIVYSRGLPEFILADIDKDDVLSSYGIDDRKILLFDDFKQILEKK